MKHKRVLALVLAAAMSVTLLAGCGGGSSSSGGGAAASTEDVDPASLTFPLAEKAEIDPNNRTIYKRLEEKTNVHVNWKSIQGDQWSDKIALEMSNIKTLPEFISPAGLSDTDILKYARERPHLDSALDRAAWCRKDRNPDDWKYAFHQCCLAQLPWPRDAQDNR